MSLDARIASAVEDLERRTSVDAAAGLERLRQTHRRRVTMRAVSTLAVVMALLVAGAVWRLGGPPRQPDPAPDRPHVSNGALVAVRGDGAVRRAPLGDVVAIGGSIAHLPDDVPEGAHLIWSADGTELVYSSSSRNLNLVAFNVETGDVRTLMTCATWCPAGASPDTSRIALAAKGELRISTPDGESVVPLPGLRPSVPVWSPDATRIAFAAPTGLYVVGADGSGLHRLIASPDERLLLIPPSWSPDGASLAYIEGTPDDIAADDVVNATYSVVAVDATSGSSRYLADAGQCVCLGLPAPVVAWSPDGSLVGFTVPGPGVFAVPALGGEVERLSDEVHGGGLAWQPVID